MNYFNTSNMEIFTEQYEALQESVLVKGPGFCKAMMPKVVGVCRNQKILNDLSRYIFSYIDRNSEVLYAVGPMKQLVFSEEDKDILFNITGISKEDIRAALSQTSYIQKKWVISNDPFNLLITCMIMELGNTKKEKEARVLLNYLCLKLYTSKFFRSFKYEPNENIMKYTINNLSNKYNIKQTGNLFDALVLFMDTVYDTYVKKISSINDKVVCDFINGVDTRIGSFVKGIATEFYKASEEKKYMNNVEEVRSDDMILTNDNHMYVIGRVSQNIATKLSTVGVDLRVVQLSARINTISEIALRNAIEQIDKDYQTQQAELVKNIITMYVDENKDATDSDLGSNQFFAKTMDLYKRNNTVDPILLAIRDTINEWIKITSPKYAKSNRVATLNNFRKAIFSYYVIYITKYQN